MMTDERFATVKAEVSASVDFAGALVGVIAPELIPLVVLGKALAKQFPEVYRDVEDLIRGEEPDEAAEAELAEKISRLGRPEKL